MGRIWAGIALFAFLPFSAWGGGFEEAGAYYGVNPALLEAISYVESRGDPQAVGVNKNGSVDRGHMQINSQWWELRGQVDGDALFDPEYCTMVGAWILAGCQAAYPDPWDAVACYHTGASPGEWERRAQEATTEKKRGENLERRDRGLAYAWKVYEAMTGKKRSPAFQIPRRDPDQVHAVLSDPFANCR